MRSAPIPSEVSDYIVNTVLKEERILIRGGITFHDLRYRFQTGGGRDFIVERTIQHSRDRTDTDKALHDYFAGRVAHRGLPNAESCGLQSSPLSKKRKLSFSDDETATETFRQMDTTGGEAGRIATIRSGQDLAALNHVRSSSVMNQANPQEVPIDQEVGDSDESGIDAYTKPNVSEVQIRRATIKMLEKQSRLFDEWTRLAVQLQNSLRTINETRTVEGKQTAARKEPPSPFELGDANLESSIL
ncbi:hypothetical protein Aduo_018756 [Ancylostoma duodenale]